MQELTVSRFVPKREARELCAADDTENFDT